MGTEIRADQITAYARTLDTGTLAHDLIGLGDWRQLGEEDRVLRRVLINVLCDRHPEANAACRGYDADSRPVAEAALTAWEK